MCIIVLQCMYCSSYRVAAKDKAFLKRMSINYVLNTAEGKRFTQVDTDHLYYRDCHGMHYKGFQLMDLPSTDISKYFYIAANFIDEGLSSGGIYDWLIIKRTLKWWCYVFDNATRYVRRSQEVAKISLSFHRSSARTLFNGSFALGDMRPRFLND